MARVSLVGHADLQAGYDGVVAVASVLKYTSGFGVSTLFCSGDALARDWAHRFGVPVTHDPATLADAELVFRCFPPGAWPARPARPKVVDFVSDYPGQDSGEADWVISLYHTGLVHDVPGHVLLNQLFPLPPEFILAHRARVVKHAVVFLGDDPNGRAAGVAAACAAGLYTAEFVSFPTVVRFWEDIARAEVLVAAGATATYAGAALGIPTVTVANGAGEDARVQAIDALGLHSWNYLGPLSGVTDQQIASAVWALMGDATKMRALSAQGLLRGYPQGSRRIAEWLYRYNLGSRLGALPVWPYTVVTPDPGVV